MASYILRRLLLVIPTLVGIMVLNFVLVQFIPGGPIEQIISQMEGRGDVFQGIAGGGGDAGMTDSGSYGGTYVGARGLPPEFIAELELYSFCCNDSGFHGCVAAFNFSDIQSPCITTNQ